MAHGLKKWYSIGLDGDFEEHETPEEAKASAEEWLHIARGNDIESDQCCPQALNELNIADGLREKLRQVEAENTALRGKIESMCETGSRKATVSG